MANREGISRYIDKQIDLSGKKLALIAEESGLKNANFISMIRKGKADIPPARVYRFAKSLNIDPLHLLKMVLEASNPEIWQAIEKIVGNIPTGAENEMLRIYRKECEVSKGTIELEPMDLVEIQKVIQKAAQR